MSDVQIALVILGLIIIFFMIIFNWIQLKKIREKQKKNGNNAKQSFYWASIFAISRQNIISSFLFFI